MSASGRYVRSLTIALGIGAGFMVLEFVVGFATGSLALISDAAHMFTDVLGVGMALTAIILARRSGPTVSRTFGLYRAEVLAALGNAILLFGVAGYVLVEAVGRISDPPAVAGLPVLLAATASTWWRTSCRSRCCARGRRRASTSAARTSRCWPT